MKRMILPVLFLAAGDLQSGSSMGSQLEIDRFVLIAGGDVQRGGQFELKGGPGQVTVDLSTSSGGAYELQAGFWQPDEILMFKDSFE